MVPKNRKKRTLKIRKKGPQKSEKKDLKKRTPKIEKRTPKNGKMTPIFGPLFGPFLDPVFGGIRGTPIKKTFPTSRLGGFLGFPAPFRGGPLEGVL